MEEATIRQKIKEAIAKVSDIQVDDIGDAALYVDDLGLDSLVLLEVAVDLELEFGLEVPEEKLKELRSIQDTVELVQQSLAEKP